MLITLIVSILGVRFTQFIEIASFVLSKSEKLALWKIRIYHAKPESLARLTFIRYVGNSVDDADTHAIIH